MNRQYEIQPKMGSLIFPARWNIRAKETSLRNSIKIVVSTENRHVWRLGYQSLSSYFTDFHDAFDVDSYADFPNLELALFCPFSIFCPKDGVMFSG